MPYSVNKLLKQLKMQLFKYFSLNVSLNSVFLQRI